VRPALGEVRLDRLRPLNLQSLVLGLTKHLALYAGDFDRSRSTLTITRTLERTRESDGSPGPSARAGGGRFRCRPKSPR
jgi:hypothetical protein